MRKRSVLLLVLAVVVALMLFPGSAAEADLNRLLRGDYAFSGTQECLVSINGFSPTLTPIGSSPLPFVTSSSVQGIRTFNGDGTGTTRSRSVSVTAPNNPFTGGASSSDTEGSFTYSVAPDGTFTTQSSVPFTGRVLTGTRADQTFTITDFPGFAGFISKDRKTLTIASEEPSVEVVRFFNGPTLVAVQPRICHRSRIHLKLKNQHHDDD